ncbi:MAG: dTMP kinase [bacterium]|nr:dTMP kinase [bacterium]
MVFEGGESVGKSTQAALLAESRGADVTAEPGTLFQPSLFAQRVEMTFEPGRTLLGQELRRLLLSYARGRLDALTEAFLMAADRAQHVAETIRPALLAGRDVVCDRYIGSSLAYQGFGRGIDVEVVRQLSEIATGGLWPDLVILLDMDPEQAWRRGSAGDDRFEALDMDFHRRVRQGYLDLAKEDPTCWAVINADRSLEEVRDDIAALVAERLGWA